LPNNSLSSRERVGVRAIYKFDKYLFLIFLILTFSRQEMGKGFFSSLLTHQISAST
jgi:hypothetical protein